MPGELRVDVDASPSRVAARPAPSTDGATSDAAPLIAVRLAGPTDWAGFVRVARVLAHDSVPAERVRWEDGEATGAADLFDPAVGARPASAWPAAAPLDLPTDWVSMASAAALHADPQRWALIYRIAARLHRQPALAGDPLDPDLRQLERLAHAVRREAHKMKAFVRFRPVAAADGQLRHIAWFEPEHHVQERVAPFFARRFTQMHWLILTPRISLAWDGATLT
ncbi:MAG: TIGR03915 family putative DNA repair protein, partial [Burkholderiaceae bacterium]